MNVLPISSETDVDEIRHLVSELGEDTTIVDFEEHIQLRNVRDSIRLWWDGDNLVGFGYVDDFCNLWFDTKPHTTNTALEEEIIAWGVQCLQMRNHASGEQNTLDHCCNSTNRQRRDVLLRNGFVQATQRSLYFSRSLAETLNLATFLEGYTWRCVNNSDSIESLVSLHQEAFGTQNMTVEYRQAMMNAPDYQPDLDLVAVSPDGLLCAFCICGFYDKAIVTGYTDPIGTHPHHQQKGLAKALVSVGMGLLAERGAQKVELGTSSENLAMQQLAKSLGFTCVSEKLWFSREVGSG